MNLQLDDFDDAYVRAATIKECPNCNAEVRLNSLIVGDDGIWRLQASAGSKAVAAGIFRRYNVYTDRLDFQFVYNTEETAALNRLANRNASADLDLFRRIALWKLDRVLEIPKETISRLRALATAPDVQRDSAEVREILEELVECAGIGVPMASTILKFLRPDIFPIIDVRAYRAVYGKKLYWRPDSVKRNIDLYLSYASDVDHISNATGRPLREIDEQLYCFDLAHNGRI